MKHALQQQSELRHRAETNFAEEQRRRVDLERTLAALQAENAALNAEKLARLVAHHSEFPSIGAALESPVPVPLCTNTNTEQLSSALDGHAFSGPEHPTGGLNDAV